MCIPPVDAVAAPHFALLAKIGRRLGLASPSTVHAHLANLERAGLLRRDPTKPRALELVGRVKATETVAAELPKLPLLGQIAAGGPLLADQNIEDEIAVPESLRGDFLLRVKGDSMIEAGILDGDIVVVRRAQDARNGDIVVALAGDEHDPHLGPPAGVRVERVHRPERLGGERGRAGQIAVGDDVGALHGLGHASTLRGSVSPITARRVTTSQRTTHPPQPGTVPGWCSPGPR